MALENLHVRLLARMLRHWALLMLSDIAAAKELAVAQLLGDEFSTNLGLSDDEFN